MTDPTPHAPALTTAPSPQSNGHTSAAVTAAVVGALFPAPGQDSMEPDPKRRPKRQPFSPGVATCETHGHLRGADDRCMMCKEPMPRTAPGLQGVAEEQGPLVRQPASAARLARVLHHAATELWDACTYTDSAQMWEEARAIASRILTAAPGA